MKKAIAVLMGLAVCAAAVTAAPKKAKKAKKAKTINVYLVTMDSMDRHWIRINEASFCDHRSKIITQRRKSAV